MTRRDTSIRSGRAFTEASEMFATAIAAAGSGSPAETSLASTSTPFARAFSRRRFDRRLLDVDTEDRCEPEPRGGDREDARSTADVEQGADVDLLEELQAEPGRRVRARPEGATGIDDDSKRIGRWCLPRRPDPERPHSDRLMERAPPVLPAGLDVGAARSAEEVPEALFAAGVGIRGELDPLRTVDFLESLGEELEHGRARLLEPLRADLDCDSTQAAQRNALFSLSKKPSSWR